LAEKMGGKIELISEPGKGTTFFLTIETSYEAGDKPEPAYLTDIKRVLIIDDNDTNRLVLEQMLNTWGIEITGCDNGLTALQIIKTSLHFDVIIVDYHMPNVNGLDTIKMIRGQLQLSPEIQPIIVLYNSSDDVSVHEACIELGVQSNIIKPVKSHDLLQSLKNIRKNPTINKADHMIGSEIEQRSMALDAAPVILIAEDVPMNMLLVKTIVKQILPNAKLVEAKNGKEALEKALTIKPSIILMDVQMPEMSGLQATEKIREFELDNGEHISIVALTAGVVKGEEEKCRKAGMDDFLTKPIDQVALRKILEKYVMLVPANISNVPLNDFKKKEYSHFDHNLLLERIDNDSELFNTFLDVAPTQFSNYIDEIETAIVDCNNEDIRRCAHSLKGAALSMCFPYLAELAQDIEKNAGTMDTCNKEVMESIKVEWDFILSAIVSIQKTMVER